MDQQPEEPIKNKPKDQSKGKVFLTRAMSASILWGTVTAAVVWENALLCFVIIALSTLGGLWEFLSMAAPRTEAKRYRFWAFLVSITYLITTYVWCSTTGGETPFWLDAAAIALMVQGAFVLPFFSELEGRKTLDHVFTSILGFLYTVFLGSFLIRVLYLKGADPDTGAVVGVYLMIYVIAVTKFTDMGAYLVGSLIGKHKMIPHISPKKTWQGFGGALLFAQLASALVIWLAPEKMSPVTFGHGAILALILGVWTVCGDLAESVLKRCYGAKDSGRSLPGIGGALDLIDSILYTGPVFYFYFRFVLGG